VLLYNFLLWKRSKELFSKHLHCYHAFEKLSCDRRGKQEKKNFPENLFWLVKIFWKWFSTFLFFKKENICIYDLYSSVLEFLLGVETLKLGKASGCGKLIPELLKALNRGVLWLTRVCQVAWYSGRPPKVGQTGVLRPHTKEGKQEWMHRLLGHLFHPWKSLCHLPCKKCRAIVEPKWMMPRAFFGPGRSRGVTRLVAARGKKQVCRPHVRTWGLSETNVVYWSKCLWHCWDVSASP